MMNNALREPLLDNSQAAESASKCRAESDGAPAAELTPGGMPLNAVAPLSVSWRCVTFALPANVGKRRSKGWYKGMVKTTRKGEKESGVGGESGGGPTAGLNLQRKPQEQGKAPVAMREILSNCSGHAPAAACTAIMGPTGSGKSSLLNALCGRVPRVKGARLEGEVMLNGGVMREEVFAKMCAYVVQDDVLYSFLTVRETLLLASHFYLPSSIPKEQKHAYVDQVINALGLAKASESIIGDERVRGVSGGERKRVSVGVELISNPSLLFLDEPTSGLDAFAALSVMHALKSLAASGRTVVLAIHQPRSAIYDLFDHLIVISEGRIMYAGPAEEAVQYFTRVGFTCPDKYCPSDYFIDIVSMDYRSEELEEATRQRIDRLGRAWGMHGGPHTPHKSHSTSLLPPGLLFTPRDLESMVVDTQQANQPRFNSTWGTQFVMLFGRGFKQSRRNNFALTIKVVTAVFFALVLGAIYSAQEKPLGQKSVQNFIGALFFVSVNQAFTNVQGVIQVFPTEKHIVQKERASNAYRLSSYYLAKITSELPFVLPAPLLFCLVAYYIVGFQPGADRLLLFIVICLSEAITATGLGILVSSFSPDVPSALALAPPLLVVFLLFSGVFINVSSLPTGAQWCPYISFVKWAFQALAINQFTGLKFRACESPASGCLSTGEDVLVLYALDDYSIVQCIAALYVIAGVFVVVGYVVLRVSSRRYMSMEPPTTHSEETKGESTVDV